VERVLFIYLTTVGRLKTSVLSGPVQCIILPLRTWAIRHKNVKAPGIHQLLSFSNDLGRRHKCRCAPVTCPMPLGPPVVPSPAIAASSHEFHARLFPLFFPGHSEVNTPVVTLTLSQAQQQ
jgi:hypothetical protein